MRLTIRYLSFRYLLSIIQGLLVAMWTGTAIAAGVLVGSGTAAEVIVLDPMLIGLSCVIATLAGASVLAFTVNQIVLKDPTKPIIAPVLLCSSHMLGSWAAGVLAFILSRVYHQGPWESLLAVFMFSLAGSKALDVVAEKYFGKRLTT